MSYKENQHPDREFESVEQQMSKKLFAEVRFANNETIRIKKDNKLISCEENDDQNFNMMETLRQEMADQDAEKCKMENVYQEFLEFEKKTRADMNSKREDMIRSIMQEKMKIKMLEEERLSIQNRFQTVQINITQLKIFEENYQKNELQLRNQTNDLLFGWSMFSIYIFIKDLEFYICKEFDNLS